ncbi:hypothetical protein FY152_05895 [Agrobacterium tumefaciens]|nr:hypothetical protein FY152_05895 [Agrobacterium tumefaciens]
MPSQRAFGSGFRGAFRALEPAVSVGAMVLALSQARRILGFNQQQHLHVTAWWTKRQPGGRITLAARKISK